MSDGIAAAVAAVLALTTPTGYVFDSLRPGHVNRNPLWYRITITYSTPAGGATSESPLDRPSILTGSYDEWTEVYFEDRSDPVKKAINTAGDRIDPLPQRKNGSLILQITKNIASYPAGDYDNFKYTTNTNAITIRGITYTADTLLFLPPTVQEVWESIGTAIYHYFATTFRLATDANKHKQKYESRGYYSIEASTYKPILDKAGLPVTAPWPLDSSGYAAASAGATPALITLVPSTIQGLGPCF